jgi:hypothetical protein
VLSSAAATRFSLSIAPVPCSASWDEQACTTFRRESLRALCVTWNVGESKPDPGSPFFRWVHEAAFGAQLAVVGLQEIEMGSSSGGLPGGWDRRGFAPVAVHQQRRAWQRYQCMSIESVSCLLASVV